MSDLIQLRADVRKLEVKLSKAIEENENLKKQMKGWPKVIEELGRLRAFSIQANRKALWLIDRLSGRREERHIERERWRRLYERIKR